MKTLILAAGYATRLYPLTKNFPKPLLEVGGKTILDRLIERVDGIEGVNQHIVVTNATFHQHFENWKAASHYTKDIVILNDGTTSNENRLGAVKDILFAIEQLGIEEDLLVLAGDNVVTFSFEHFVQYAQEKRTSCISCHEEPSLEALRKTGVLEADEHMRAIAMHEKPENPPSHWAVPPFYYYKSSDLPLIKTALENGCGYDAPGNLAAWLCRHTEVYAWPINGERYDIGDMKAYEHAQEVFNEMESYFNDMKYKKILVTGAAGFIGFHLCKALLDEGFEIVGLDNINDYYDVNLKYARLQELGVRRVEAENWNRHAGSDKYADFRFVRLNLEDRETLPQLFEKEKFDAVINLAAQAGVRYSLENPMAYVDSNLVGFVNILECCRHHQIGHLVYASSSSVYGENGKVPFSEDDRVDYPVSLYAATKKANELMAHTYSHLYKIPTSGLRFFTVYGPWGRPDMAPILFASAITEDRPIKVFNNGEMSRDFTYIDDIVQGIIITLNNPPAQEKEQPMYQVFNIGNGSPVSLMEFIETLEQNLGKVAEKNMLPMQPGDVPRTWADTEHLNALGYKSTTSIQEGVKRFVKWYRQYSF